MYTSPETNNNEIVTKSEIADMIIKQLSKVLASIDVSSLTDLVYDRIKDKLEKQISKDVYIHYDESDIKPLILSGLTLKNLPYRMYLGIETELVFDRLITLIDDLDFEGCIKFIDDGLCMLIAYRLLKYLPSDLNFVIKLRQQLIELVKEEYPTIASVFTKDVFINEKMIDAKILIDELLSYGTYMDKVRDVQEVTQLIETYNECCAKYLSHNQPTNDYTTVNTRCDDAFKYRDALEALYVYLDKHTYGSSELFNYAETPSDASINVIGIKPVRQVPIDVKQRM